MRNKKLPALLVAVLCSAPFLMATKPEPPEPPSPKASLYNDYSLSVIKNEEIDGRIHYSFNITNTGDKYMVASNFELKTGTDKSNIIMWPEIKLPFSLRASPLVYPGQTFSFDYNLPIDTYDFENNFYTYAYTVDEGIEINLENFKIETTIDESYDGTGNLEYKKYCTYMSYTAAKYPDDKPISFSCAVTMEYHGSEYCFIYNQEDYFYYDINTFVDEPFVVEDVKITNVCAIRNEYPKEKQKQKSQKGCTETEIACAIIFPLFGIAVILFLFVRVNKSKQGIK